ncbi:hypothetical protein ColKHC_08702 [Colletotrichum higginsianum]|nr:hypothetical protein ColKHC_08702 [Colletotrichum higginsianum]
MIHEIEEKVAQATKASSVKAQKRSEEDGCFLLQNHRIDDTWVEKDPKERKNSGLPEKNLFLRGSVGRSLDDISDDEQPALGSHIFDDLLCQADILFH